MKKIDLGGISASAAKTSRATHPTVECNAEMTQLLEQFVSVNPQYKTLKNHNETLTKQLAPQIRALFFSHYAGLSPDSSTILAFAGGKTVKLITKDRYSTKLEDEAALIDALGAELVTKYFHQATVLKLDLEKCPADKQEAFAAAVIKLAQDMGVTDAVSASQCIQPVAGFHATRTVALSPEQNLALDGLIPVTAYPML